MIGNLRLTCLSPGMIIRPKLGGPSPLNLVSSCPCEFWFDGQDASTISLNANKVIQWDDKSGNARHVANAVDAQRPTYSAVTGRLTFLNANSTYLQNAAFGLTLAQPNTVYILYKIIGGIGDSEIVLSSAIAANPWWIYYSGGDFYIRANVVLMDGATDANDNIHCVEFNGINSNYWINGILGANGAAGPNGIANIEIGSSHNETLNADVEIMEIFGYNCLLTAGEHTALRAYLTSKWGL